MVEALSNDQGFRVIARAAGTAPRDEVVHRLIEADHDLLRDDDSYRDFYALLSRIVLDEELRERVAVLYEGFDRRMAAWWAARAASQPTSSTPLRR